MLIGMAFEHSLAYTIVTTALVRSGDYILFSVDHNDAFVLAFSVNEWCWRAGIIVLQEHSVVHHR